MNWGRVIYRSLLGASILSGAIAHSYAQARLSDFNIHRPSVPGRGPLQPNRPFPPRDRDEDRGRRQGDRVFSEVEYIGQEVSPGERVLLGRAFSLQRDHDGQEVETISVDVFGMQRGGEAKLLVNGQKIGKVKEFSGRRSGEQTLRWTLPNRELVVGENLRTLQIEFAGKAFVMEAEIVFKEERFQRPDPRPIRPQQIFVQHDFRGEQSTLLASLISANFAQFKMEVDSIALDIRGPSFRASAQLCRADRPWDCGAMKIIGFGDHQINLQAPFGSRSEVGELVLKTKGQFFTDKVTLFPSR